MSQAINDSGQLDALRVDNLAKNFGGLRVLEDLSFKVTPGERRAIIGPNGAGKTTLFNVITGELPVTAGKITLFGEEVTGLSNFQRARRGLARTFQKNNLFLNLSVLDNIVLVLQRKHSHSRDWFRHRRPEKYPLLYREAEELLQTWGLAHHNARHVRELSYGEQRQVEILLGMAANPKLLLLDEPTAGMSAAETQQIFQLLQSLPAEMTVLIIEHDMELVFGLADKITVLYYGRVLAEGVPTDIRTDSKVREVYLGTEGEMAYA